MKVNLGNLKCWELWARNDADLLREIARLRPDVLPPDEWAQIKQHLDFLRTPETYRQFCSKMKGPAPETWDWEFQALTQTPRWFFIVNELLPKLGFQPNGEYQFLDLGTWTGAHAVDLSNRYPQARVYAREIVVDCRAAIDFTVQKYAQKKWDLRLEFGDHLTPPLPKNCDLIFSGEVIEHVRDLDEFVRAVEAASKPRGWIVLTSPIEPPDWDPDRRHVHVRHLELEDLHELFGGKPGFGVQVIPPREIVTWWQVPFACGHIDWERKMRKWGID